jgi:hypothetical protein
MTVAGYPAGLTIASGQHVLWTGLAVAAVLAGPAVATMALLPRVTPLSRLVCMLAATLCVNGIVAEAMLILDRWSIPGGTAAVGVISAVLWLVAPARQTDAAGAVSPLGDVPPAAPDPRVAS